MAAELKQTSRESKHGLPIGRVVRQELEAGCDGNKPPAGWTTLLCLLAKLLTLVKTFIRSQLPSSVGILHFAGHQS